MTRFYFKSKIDRDTFFENILKNSKLGTWKNFNIFFKIPKSTLENYRNGNYTLSNHFYNLFNSILPNNIKEYYSDKICRKEDNWGSVKGGERNYIKNKYIYDNGRKKAWESTRKKSSILNLDVEMQLDLDFYEFVGAFIGDGFLNKYGSSYFVQFAGDSRYDLDYYQNRIIPIGLKLVHKKPYIRIKENCMWVTFYSKDLLNLLIKRFKMPAGVKVYTVKIPDEIMNNMEKLIYTLRGIFDTDGCIYTDKRKIYKIPYVRIALQLTNKPLIDQIALSLENLGITAGISKLKRGGAYNIQINGFKEVEKYINLIGFSNKRHLDKINKYYNK